MGKKLLCSNLIIDSLKNYNVLELRVFYNLLYIYKCKNVFNEFADEMEKNEPFYIPKQEITSLFTKNRLTFKSIVELIENMPNKVQFVDENGRQVGFVGVFEYFIYDTEQEEFEICFTNTIIPFLEALSNFSNIDLMDISNLSKKYSIRLYELCCRYMNQKYYSMKIDVFKKYFAVPESYKMCEIDRSILKSSIAEIEKKTNKRIKFEKIKKGKEVTHIKFTFTNLE